MQEDVETEMLQHTGGELVQSSQCRLVLLGRLLRVNLVKWVSNVSLPARPSTKSLFDFNKIEFVGRGR